MVNLNLVVWRLQGDSMESDTFYGDVIHAMLDHWKNVFSP